MGLVEPPRRVVAADAPAPASPAPASSRPTYKIGYPLSILGQEGSMAHATVLDPEPDFADMPIMAEHVRM